MIYTFRKLNRYSQVDDSLNKEHQLIHDSVLLLPHQYGLFLLTQSGPQLELKIETIMVIISISPVGKTRSYSTHTLYKFY